MSVTITISGNETYCHKHNLVEYEEFEGTKSPLYPYQLNISNSNFSTFANAIGLVDQEDDMWTGEIYPQKLKRLIACFDPQLAVREQNDDDDNGSRFIDCGLPEEKVDRYLTLLTIMAEEAERREEKIVWC